MASSSRTFKRNASAVSTRQLPPPAKVGRVYTPVAEDDDPMFDAPRIELEEFIPAPLPSSSQSSTLPLQTIAPTSPLSRKSRRKGRQKASSQQASTQAIEEEREDKTQARPAHQERQNQAKREQRAQPDYRAQQVAKRAASDEASNSDIAEAWIEETSQWLCLMRRLHQLLAAPASPSSAKTTLRAIHDVVASYEHLEPLVPEVWDLLSERTAVFLLQSAKGLTKSELEKAVKDGILDLSDADDLRPFSGQLFYICVAVPQESATLATPLLSYIITHPADTPWTIVQLLRLDLDLSLICAAITSTLSPHGHAEAVNMFFDWLRASDHYLDFLQRPRLPYQDNLVYAGESHNCRPGIRHLDDVEAQLPTRLGNCLQALEESHTWQCYQIVDLDLPNSSGLRTDRIASDMEALLVSLHRVQSLNSSPGGYIRRYKPEEAVVALQAALVSPHPTLYGQDPFALTDKVIAMLQDEMGWLQRAGLPCISASAYDSAVRNFVHVLRTKSGFVPYIRIMKDIPQEDFQGQNHAAWQAESGRGIQTFCLVQCNLNPRIPLTGDLSTIIIAECLGSSIDFWRFILKHPYYWLHLVWLSRLLGIVRPVLLSSWSNAVFTMLTSGALRSVWGWLTLPIRTSLRSGITPEDILYHLPPATPHWYPLSTDGSYLQSVGNLFIVPYNEDAAALALLIPNFHSGVCKYEPALAYLAEKIIHLVGMIEHVALALVEDLTVQGVIPNRSDPNLAWEYFESLRQAIEVKLATTDVRTQLENTKQQYSCLARTSRKLRTLKTDYSNTVAAPDTVAAPYIIPGITESTPRGAPRVAQYHIIMELARSLMKGGMNPDPYHLIPFQFREDIFGSACMEWFMSREENIRYSAAARAYGGSLKAHENSLAGQQRFAADTAAHSRGGFAATEVLRAKRKEREDSREKLRKIAEVISEPLRVRKGQKPNGNHSTVDDNPYGLCPHCGAWILGIDQNCYHKCEPNSSPVKLTEDNIPSLIRLLYVHDIYNNEELASYLPSLTDLRLRRLPTQEIMDRSGNMDVLLTTFPGADVSRVESWPSIYVRADDVDEDIEFTLAVDSILPMLSTCPSDFVPINSKQRGAPWGSCRAPPDEWIGKHLLRCDFGTLALVNPPLQHHYDHACSQTAQRENAERQEKQCLGLKYSQNKSAGGPRDCGTQQATPITSLLQLPSEYLRRYWFHKRIFPIMAKKAKKGKGKAQ
ncbi:hypothetical protein B0H11DRAFT_1920957 [Mycena galericulata]|nr:hypothetical protein B0H11DRAFT_1920957 [Mycena galericulata]